MKKISLILIATIMVFVMACNKQAPTNGVTNTPKSATCPCIPDPIVVSSNIIKVNNSTVLGTMEVWNTNDSIYVKLTTPGKNFNKSAVYLGNCSTIPSNVNAYPYSTNHNPNPSTYTYVFANTYAPCDEICINGSVTGVSNGGGNGLATMTYTVREICTCDIQIGDFRTQSKGGWGAPPNGNNPANYMYNNWSSIGSVSIGCASTTMTFSTAASVTAYLPNGNGSPAPFNTNLATQVLALSISVALDNNVPSFGASNDHLACLVVVDPNYAAFVGMSVQDVLDLANDVLGGCNTSYTFSQMTSIVDAINLNFHGGTVDNGLLTCGDCD